MIRVRSILLPALFSFALIGSALAQGQSPMMSRPPAGMPPMMGNSGGAAPMQQAGAPSLHIEGELAFLKAELKITDAQSKKWDAFAEAARQSVKNVMALSPMTPTPDRSILDTMTLREKYLKTRSEGLDAMLEKFKPLYDTFSPEQKTAADQLVPTHLASVL